MLLLKLLLLLGLLDLDEVLFAGSLLFNSLEMLGVLAISYLRNHSHRVANWESIISNETCDGLTHIIDLGHFNQHRNVIEESSILRVIVPREDWHAALRLQHIWGWWVVDDYCIFHVASYLCHIFHKDTIDEGTMFTEETHPAVSLRIHHIHERVSILVDRNWNFIKSVRYLQNTSKLSYSKVSTSYLWKRCGIDHNLEVLGHLLQEVLGSRAFHNIYIRYTAFNIYGDSVIWVAHLVKLTVNESFVQV